MLASPLLGSASVPGQVPRLVYRALDQGIDPGHAEAVIDFVHDTVRREGHQIEYRERPPSDAQDGEREALAQLVRKVLALRLPVWRQLKVA